MELSPWEKADLSIYGKKAKRINGTVSEAEGASRVALSFVEQVSPGSAMRRSNKRSRRSNPIYDGADIPSLVLTTEDKIVVVVKKEGSDQSFVESPILQFQARPGTMFLPKNDQLPSISAVYDARHGHFYAVQKENKRLLSWPAGSSVDDATHKNMSGAVLSLSSLGYDKQSLVYGTLENDGLFITDGGGLLIESIAHSMPSDLHHVATLAEQCHDSSVEDRKLAQASSSKFLFYQILAGKNQIVLVKHSISDHFGPNSFKVERKTISLEKLGLKCNMESAYFIGSNKSEQSIFVGIQSGGDTFVAGLSLVAGGLQRKTFRLPSIPNTICLAKGSVLAECVNNRISLIDANRGVKLGLHPLDGTKPVVTLAADGARLVVVRECEGTLSLSLSTVLTTTVLRLADSIGMVQGNGLILPQHIVTGTFKKDSGVQSATHSCIADASAKLETAEVFLYTSDSTKYPEYFLLNSFAEAARTANFGEDTSEKTCKVGVNGTVKLNGTNHNVLKSASSPGKVKNSNGKKLKVQDHLPSLECIPSLFLNEAANRMACILTAPELHGNSSVQSDARVILKSLVRTRRGDSRTFLWGSATRNIFSKLLIALDEQKAKWEGSYPAVEFAFDLLRCSGNVTESQIVAVLHYFLAIGDPSSFASFLLHADEVEQSLTEACDLFFVLLKSREPEKENRLKKLSSRMTIATTTLFLKKIFSLSDLNMALLRRAIASTLSRNEISILLSLLQQFLLSYNDAKITRRIVDLASALCDSLCSFKTLTKVESSALSSLRSHLIREAKVANSLATLQVLVEEVCAAGDAEDEAATDLQATYEIEVLALD